MGLATGPEDAKSNRPLQGMNDGWMMDGGGYRGDGHDGGGDGHGDDVSEIRNRRLGIGDSGCEIGDGRFGIGGY